MNSVERYRRYAAECLALAQPTRNNGEKTLLLEMAETWRHLAELAEASAATDDKEGQFNL